MMKPILAVAAVLAFSAPAFAQTPDHTAADKFAKHDSNKDGALSLAEVQVADATVTSEDFDKYDGDKDKALSPDEFAKWAEAKTMPPASAPGQ
jgi:hypothetical protein